MDPSRNLCMITDSFTTYIPRENYIVKKYKSNIIGSPRSTRRRLSSPKKSSSEYLYDPKLIGTKSINNKNITDPYVKMNTIFREKSSMILANIDAIYNITGQTGGYLVPQNTKDYNFGVLKDDRAGYVEYLQYRLPASTGFVVCNSALYSDRIHQPTLDIITPSDSDNEKYINYVNTILPDGLDLLVSNDDLINSIHVSLKVLKKGANMVVKLKDTFNLDLGVLNIISLNFETISLFKPISENLETNVSYLIAQDYHNQGLGWENLIQEKSLNYTQSLKDYVTQYNNTLLEFRNNLYTYVIDNDVKDIYNMYKCKNLWNML